MNRHYYTSNEDLNSEENEIIFKKDDYSLSFLTDNGVFSKNYIDYGTRVLLNKFNSSLQPNSILDVGCGYGVIGIFLAKKYTESHIEMIDVNERAISLTKKNIKKNNISNAIVYTSDAYDNVDHLFDLIITNPPIRAGKSIVKKIMGEAKEKLNQNGELWAVMRKSHGAKSMIEYMKQVFGNCEIIAREKGYYIFYCVKR